MQVAVRRSVERPYLIVFGSVAIVLATIAAVAYLDQREYESASAAEAALESSIDTTRDLLRLSTNAENAQVAYLLTGDEQLLAPYREGIPRIQQDLAAIQALEAGHPGAASVANAIRSRLKALDSAIEARRRGELRIDLAALAQDRIAADDIRRRAGELATSMQAELTARRRRNYTYEKRARVVIAGGAFLLALLLVGATLRSRRLAVSIKAAQERYQLLFESNPQPMWVYDQATLAFLAVNEAATAKYGYSREEFLRMTLKDIRPEEDVPKLLEATREPIAGLNTEGPWRHRKRDGSIILVEINEHPIVFDGKQCSLVSPRDITAEQETLKALKESRERLQFALDAANEGLWDWTVTTGEGYFGPRYCTILGYEPEELPTGHDSWRRLVHPDDLARANAQRDEQIARTGAFRTEYRMRKKNGEFIWVQSLGRVVKHTLAGTPERIVGTIVDITERKALEAQFYQAQRLESVGRLAGGVAHDFNNLLSVISGYAEMLRTDLSLRPAEREKADEIRAAGERAARLTQQLLAFSRKQMLQMRSLNLNEVVADAEKMLARLIGEQIRLVNKLTPDLGNVMADAGQMQQVLMNLAVNSRDAMPDGGVVTVETANVEFGEDYASRHPQTRPGSYIMLALSDTGTGMPPEVRDHIFEPFFTTKPQGSGTGLGLATVYGIVKQSGGWIWVYSEVGRGTTFKIYLPRTDEAPMPVVTESKRELRGSEVILVVEDQAEVRRVATRALRDYGYTVHATATAGEALDLVEMSRNRFDLLLSDVVMPGMSGPDLAARLRQLWPALPVLLMSGYTDDAVTHRGIEAEGYHYLQKPFTPDALARKVRDALGPSRSQITEILVVDDDSSVRRVLRSYLESAGYRVIEAASGEQANEKIDRADGVRLAIVDLVMPGETGAQTIEWLRARTGNLRIIAISGAFPQNAPDIAAYLGADLAVPKPVTRGELLNAVRSLLQS